jgi:hypothetical protein
MNTVTKSGTNHFQGSIFEFFRDRSMNALTETEKLAVREQRRGEERLPTQSVGGSPAARSRKRSVLLRRRRAYGSTTRS